MANLHKEFLKKIEELRGGHYTIIVPENIPCEEISDPAELSKNPLVSVLMTAYNHEPYIRKAIESIITQKTDFPFELIIGEDCSTDATRAIVLDFQRKFPQIIRVFVSETNVGATSNAMRCVFNCRGAYVAYCEGDDFWTCTFKLMEQVAFLRRHSDVGLVHSNANRLDVRSNRLAERIQTPHEHDILGSMDAVRDLIERKWWVITCTAMVRRDLMWKLFHDFPALYYADRPLWDTLLWVGCAARMKCGYLQNVMATYVLSPDSASRPKDPKKALLFYGACLEAHLTLNQTFAGDDDNTRRIVIEIFICAMFPVAYQAGQRALAKMIRDVRKENGLCEGWRNRTLRVCMLCRVPYMLAWNLTRAMALMARICAKTHAS